MFGHKENIVASVKPVRRGDFNPYEDNGGSIGAIAGDDFAVIAADTRLCRGYNILTRQQTKLFKLANGAVLATSGCWCDSLTLSKYLEAHLRTYHYEHDQNMSLTAVAQSCATMLYARRFFPYFTWTVLAGIDEKEKGVVYAYDPVGHMESKPYASGGSSSALIMPLLDSIIGKKNQEHFEKTSLSKKQAVALLKDVFISAAERDIHCGDSVHIMVVTKDGIEELSVELRKD
ncbi:proteasome subunit beta type-1-like [Tropilaelaps mercedesae]|uniref:Proteasome subunit beta type-1-like n=1 Tax=Tropilaelaps mercedesae TaxID=418985 RepID=A0A1V9Y2Q8_9ACAR|nr:proteasome subunit beta type-1-like [Tropilaelaps mercedesae]